MGGGFGITGCTGNLQVLVVVEYCNRNKCFLNLGQMCNQLIGSSCIPVLYSSIWQQLSCGLRLSRIRWVQKNSCHGVLQVMGWGGGVGFSRPRPQL